MDPTAQFDLAGSPRTLLTTAFEQGVSETGGRRDLLSRTPGPARTLDLKGLRNVRSRSASVGSADDRDDPDLPRVGDTLFGFRITRVLGRGGFGVVYQGEQLDLGGREVALKFTLRPSREPELLAALQHTHIVPVYSVHSRPPMQVICMPYLGDQTLADVVRDLDATTRTRGDTGARLLSTRRAAKDDTRDDPVRRAMQPTARTPVGRTVRDLLAARPYPDAVAWLFARLGEGLAHAHARGIVHLDLKPANVLLTHDGVPMVLDFGLAHDAALGEYDRTGGTVRYMSPEQLAQFAAGRMVPDRRMDLYALGLMMFELLAHRHPFEKSLTDSTSLSDVIAARRGMPPALRGLAPGVPPGLEAVVLKLLHPDPAKRYQSADALVADLNGHLDNRPLKHAANPSPWELAVKFRRRHPALLLGGLAAVLGLSTLAASGTAVKQAHTAAVAKATAVAAAAADDLHPLRIDLSSRDEPEARAKAIRTVEKRLAEYGVATDDRWAEKPAVKDLTAEQRAHLQVALGEMALLAAHAERMDAVGKPASDAAAAFGQAVEWNERAEKCYPRDTVPRAVNEQRAALATAAKLDLTPVEDSRLAAEGPVDFYLRGLDHALRTESKEAAKSFAALVEIEPHHAAGQYALGLANESLGKYDVAAERYQVAKALAKNEPRPAVRRGRLLVLTRKYAEAETEFTAALARDPNSANTLYLRGITRRVLDKHADAIDDATAALKLGGAEYRVRTLRADLYRLTGNDVARAEDEAALAKLTPADEVDYAARGYARLKTEPADALADFNAAIDRNPAYLVAWQNKAVLLSDYLDQPVKAVDAYDRVLDLAPNYVDAKSLKAVLLAQLGKRSDAVKLAEELAAAKPDATVLYRLACVYSQTADDSEADKEQAVKHLRAALKAGYGRFAAIETDANLRAIRTLPEVTKMVEAARELQN